MNLREAHDNCTTPENWCHKLQKLLHVSNLRPSSLLRGRKTCIQKEQFFNCPLNDCFCKSSRKSQPSGWEIYMLRGKESEISKKLSHTPSCIALIFLVQIETWHCLVSPDLLCNVEACCFIMFWLHTWLRLLFTNYSRQNSSATLDNNGIVLLSNFTWLCFTSLCNGSFNVSIDDPLLTNRPTDPLTERQTNRR